MSALSEPTGAHVAGLLLAAGAGRRAGGPKALRTSTSGWTPESGAPTWVERGVARLAFAGCERLLVVVGAQGPDVIDGLQQSNLPQAASCEVVQAVDWHEGMGASLRAGLDALQSRRHGDIEAALVMLVDLPDVGVDVLRRVLGAVTARTTALSLTQVLSRAAYHGVPGHPVVIGRAHWAGVIASAQGDRGAREYLSAHDVNLIECADLATGVDQDNG